jgi:AraC-like DNA-binding protein
VKEDGRTGHIGFILLSARAAHESRLSGLRKGADEYLTKPFHLDELEIKLSNLAEQQKRVREHLQKDLLPLIPHRDQPHINDIFVRNLYKQLDERTDDPHMSVESLAQSVNMSQRTLNRKLKAILNLTPVELIRQFRLQKAAILLSAGQGVTDTAYQVGFETASYFTQCFKEQFGKTPSEFIHQQTS